MRTTSIKDTIHGYIELDAFEKRVVDSPWFQRMRRVRQNDVASYVYPTMLTTRFEHSLGAMHLAGACLDAALHPDNSGKNRDAFLRQLGTELAALGIKVANDWVPSFARRCARMYGALHDIGHPPYSHLIEACYTPAQIGMPSSPTEHWHEANGADIVQQYLPAAVSAENEDADVLKTVAHLSSKRTLTPALSALKGLVDSVIDVDRMDFVRRDGRNSGSEFGIYDLHRLVDSFRVYVEEAPSELSPTILIRPLHKALSAIESLIQERYKIYRWVLFHHRVMQSRALTRYVIDKTRTDAEFDPHQFQGKNYVPWLSAGHAEPDKYRYVMLGDGVVDQHLDRNLRALMAKKTPLSSDDARLYTALRILVLREDLGVSLWKRTDDYNSDRDESSFESRLKAEFAGTPSPPRARLLNAYGSYANWVANVLGREVNRQQIVAITETLNASGGANEWYLLEVPGFKGSRDESILVQDSEKGGLKPDYLSDVSTVAPAVDAARKNDVHLFAFRFSDHMPTPDQETRWKREGRARLAKLLAHRYRTDPMVREKFNQIPS